MASIRVPGMSSDNEEERKEHHKVGFKTKDSIQTFQKAKPLGQLLSAFKKSTHSSDEDRDSRSKQPSFDDPHHDYLEPALR
jgi:hypothetical protein